MNFIKKHKLIFSLVSLLFIGGIGVSAGKGDFNVAGNIDILFNIIKDVSIMYVDEVDSDKLIKIAANAMLSTLDPYTEYIPQSEVETFEISTTGKYGGVGSVISKSEDSTYVQFINIYKGFPIHKAGITAGDKIIEIDGKSMKGTEISSVSSALKGEPGSIIKIKTKSLRSGEVKEFTLKRERVAIAAVPYHGYIGDSVGYIALNTFSEGCAAEVKKAVADLRATGNLSSLIIDLRENGGGIMTEAIDIVSLFVPKGSEVLSAKGRLRKQDIIYKTTTDPIEPNIPIAVVVDNFSASASEIVAGALQDHDRAVIVGNRTFGKGLIQSTKGVGFGGMIKVTTAKYYIPSGRCIQAIDYSHRNEDGSVGTLPDSLITEFATKAGRKVYDGGGISPDIKTTAPHYSKFPISLLALGYIDNYSLQYYKENLTAPSIRNFSLSDSDYEKFKEYIKDKNIDFESRSETNLKRLIESAKREKYYDKIQNEISQIEKALVGDRMSDLELYKDDIKGYLESAIINKYHYTEGESEYAAIKDTQIRSAIDVLSDKSRYNEILSPSAAK